VDVEAGTRERREFAVEMVELRQAQVDAWVDSFVETLESGRSPLRRAVSAGSVRRLLFQPSHLAPLRSVLVDTAGNVLMVQPSSTQRDGMVWILLDVLGRTTDRAIAPDGWRPASLAGDRIVAVREMQNGKSQIAVIRLRPS